MIHAAPWDDQEALEIVTRHRQLPGAALPILHALQERFGYIDRAAIPMVAEVLNLSQAEIHGVVAFYDDFREQPPGRHTLTNQLRKVCINIIKQLIINAAYQFLFIIFQVAQ